MPTYSYACTACGHRFDAQQSFSDAALTECPECRGRLRKLFGSVGVVFKGSGFYRTDARTGAGTKDGASKDSGARSGADGAAGAGGSAASTPASAPSAPAAATSGGSGSTGSSTAAAS